MSHSHAQPPPRPSQDASRVERWFAAWQRYLPQDFSPAPSHPDAQHRIVTHLQAVWRAVQTYLPRRAVRRLLGSLEPGEMWGELAEGTFLFADISGFTALTDRLSALPDGTEQIAAMINDYFTSMLRVVDQSCREIIRAETVTLDAPYDLLKFGGDAMLFLFSGPDHARLAVHAARRMQQNMAQVAQKAQSLGASGLSMHIGVNSGRFLDAHVGTARVMKKIEVGQTLNLTAKAETLAGPGQTAIGPNTYRAVQSWAVARPTSDGFYLLQNDGQKSAEAELSPAPTSPLKPPKTPDGLAAALDILVPYLLPGLLEKIVLDPFAPVVWADLKSVTVLFANLLGVTEMLSAITKDGDVQEMTAILDRYLGAVSEIVARYDGTFNKMDLAQEGDKLLILFGAPHAHEDDPQRAVRAALEMQEALRPFTDLPTPWGAFTLRLRVGIHSGNVFAGNVGTPERKEYTVMGDTVNLAARIMAAADPGQILVSRETRRRLDESFACQPPFDLHLKGIPRPMPACEVIGLQQTSFAARRITRHTPLVGRQEEMTILKAAAGQTLGGEGQVISVEGDAGVGKSRLVDELAAHAEGLGMRVLRGGCVSYGSAMAYLPWTELLRAFLNWTTEDTSAQRREKLRETLSTIDPALAEWAPIVAGVLGLALPETPLTRALDARLRKERFFDLVSQMLEARAQTTPMLLIFEDLHWADPISLELLDYVARNLADSPILLVGARRPEGVRPQWDELPHHRAIILQELSADESRALTAALLQIGTLPTDLEILMLKRAQGNPFYVEEVVHMLKERGYLRLEDGGYHLTGDASSIEIPETINGVVMSRIDSLDEGSRTVLRVASVIGRIFGYDPLKAIYPQSISHPALQRRLETLQRVDLTPLEESEPNLRYVFKHILTQEVAYESLLHARRRDLHGQVAHYYETTHGESGLEEYYDLLAYHFGRSIHRTKAVEYAIRAGDRARDAYANDTAIRHYARALELLQEQGERNSRRWAEVQFNLAEVHVLVGHYQKARASYRQALETAGSNWSAEQQARALRKIGMTHESQGQYNRALNWLLRAKTTAQSDPQAARSRQMARILADEGAVHMRQGEYRTAIGLIEQALTLLAQLPRDSKRIRDEGWAYTRLGVIQVHRGDLLEARKFFEKSLELREQAGDLVGVATLHNNLGYIAHHLQGDTEMAIRSYERSLSVSNRIGYRYMMAMTVGNLGLAYQTLGDYLRAITHYRQSLQIRQEMGDQPGIASTYDNLGLAHHQRGDYPKAMEYHHLSLEIKRQQEDAFQIANSLLNIAAVCRDQEHYEEALAFAEEALEIFEEIGGRQFLAENHSLLAEVMLASQAQKEAHRHATLALETAQETSSPKDEAIAARVLGEVEAALGINTASHHLRQSVVQLEEINDRFEMAKSLRSLGRWLKRAGQKTEGESRLKRAIQIFKDLDAQGELKKMHEPSSVDQSFSVQPFQGG